MNFSKILNIILALAVISLTAKLAFFNRPATESTEASTNASAMNSEESTAGKWSSIDPKDLEDNPFSLFSNAMALTVGTKEKMNSMTIGWGSLGVLWGRERPVVTVYVEERRYTRLLMEENEYFTVEAFSHEYDQALHYLGTVSGRDEDKIKGSGLTLKMIGRGTPAFEEGRLILECKKIYGAPFNPEGFGELGKKEYSNRPLHTIYIGEIIHAYIKV